MTINRRTILTGAALAPFVPVVAAAGVTTTETVGRVEMLHPKDWKCHVDKDGDVVIDAYVWNGHYSSLICSISFTPKSDGGENSNHSHEVWQPSVEMFDYPERL